MVDNDIVNEAIEPVVEAAKGENQEAIPSSGPIALTITPSAPVLVQCREELDPILQRHRLWIDSVLNPSSSIAGGRANLCGSDLSGFDLSGFDLRGANLSKCLMRGTLLRATLLTGANLSESDLQGADLRDAKLRRANLERADLRSADLDGVDFEGAHLRFTRFTDKDAENEDQVIPEPEMMPSSEIVSPIVDHSLSL